jgi:hypothetical protein
MEFRRITEDEIQSPITSIIDTAINASDDYIEKTYNHQFTKYDGSIVSEAYETPYHYVFEILVDLNSTSGRTYMGYLIYVYVNKKTHKVDECTETSEDVKEHYMEWLAPQIIKDISGILDL